MVGSQNLLDFRNGKANGFGCLLTLGLVGRVGLMPEGTPVWVKSHPDVGGLLLLEHLLQGVHEAQDGRGVLPFGIDAWVLDEGIVSAIDERVCIEKE